MRGEKMKYFIASDIHGSAYWCEKMLEKYKESGASRLILLGDILYHGPRNDLPRDYAPKKVIAMLNPLKNQIYAVRGNCEAEVDQMVLEFPVMADYALLSLNGHTIYATHGHLFNEDALPPISDGDALLHGHTHLLKAEKLERDGIRFYHLNPGSTSLPKGGNPNTYAVLDGDTFTVYDFDEHVVKEITLL
jgi:putative phosphoesterase